MSDILVYHRGGTDGSVNNLSFQEIVFSEGIAVHGVNRPLAKPNISGLVYGPHKLTSELCTKYCPVAQGVVQGVICSQLGSDNGNPGGLLDTQGKAFVTSSMYEQAKQIKLPDGTSTNVSNPFSELAFTNQIPCQAGDMIFPNQVAMEQATLTTSTPPAPSV